MIKINLLMKKILIIKNDLKFNFIYLYFLFRLMKLKLFFENVNSLQYIFDFFRKIKFICTNIFNTILFKL